MSGLAPGSVIAGRYQVEAQIGIGGMASVYRAEDIQLGRKVAVKVLHDQYAEDQEFVERFRREAKAAAQLQHPGIVSVYDTGSWDGTWYIAMELLDGPTLKEKIQHDGRFAPSVAVGYTEQILRAVRAAHRDGIIHRDIKPHNVILDDEGRPKVTDFGIARRGASDMTQTGSVLGTAHYIAPEQAQGEVITPRTDLYSVGVMLYEMLTGRTPFEGDTAVSIALAHVNNEPRSPRSLVPDIPPALDAVVMRALAKRPSDRFADADAFLAALSDAGRGIAPVYAPNTGEHPVTAETQQVRRGEDRRAAPVPVASPAPWYRKPWVIALGVLALVAAIVAVLVLTTKPRVPVPSVVGATLETAQTRLEREGFEVTVSRREDNKPEDTVLAQNPPGGTEAEEGSRVRLVVSAGAGTATVPQVDGQTVEVARDRLQAVGFDTEVERRVSSDVDSGKVIETQPSGGSIAPLDRPVTIVVSSGPEEVVVPSVVGSPLEAARTTLEDAGLRVQVTEQESAEQEPGTVLAQSPDSGTKTREGETVKLTVAADPAQVEVPDVIGRTQASAIRTLESAGFNVRVRTEQVADQTQDGNVIRTTPSAGEDRDAGSTVTIVIGQFVEPTPTQTTP